MNRVVQIFAGLAGVIHVLFFVMESILWMNPDVHSVFQVQNLADAEILYVYVQNQGFYNLFLAFGTFTGLFLYNRKPEVGKAFVIYTCLFMIGAAAVLRFTIPAMSTGMFIQGGPPLIALAALAYTSFK